jgi:hypothetical protein
MSSLLPFALQSLSVFTYVMYVIVDRLSIVTFCVVRNLPGTNGPVTYNAYVLRKFTTDAALGPLLGFRKPGC